LIDFEFARPHARTFDLGASFAPLRNSSGEFILATNDYLKAVLNAYQQRVKLSAIELRSIPIAAAMRFCLIQDGLFQENNAVRSSALRVLQNILSRLK
jgi:Ser/Thr protein kinase RdoA (MazF antagonist)